MRSLRFGPIHALIVLVLVVSVAAGGAALAAKGGNKGGGGGDGGGKGGGKGGKGNEPAIALAGAGDSIMRGYNASCTDNTTLGGFWCLLGGEQPENSFFDGSSGSVVSLLDRYRTVSSTATSWQAAQSGSEMTDVTLNNFEAQASSIVSSATSPVRVVVELGGNDICNRDSVAELYSDSVWQNAVDTGLGVLVDGLPDGSTVFLASVPRVQDLRLAGLTLQSSDSDVDCEGIWTSAGICPIATMSDQSTLLALGERQRRYNEILWERAQVFNAHASITGVEVVAEYQGESVPSVGTFAFGAEDVNGGDCFHPSIKGQNTIAELLWNGNLPK